MFKFSSENSWRKTNDIIFQNLVLTEEDGVKLLPARETKLTTLTSQQPDTVADSDKIVDKLCDSCAANDLEAVNMWLKNLGTIKSSSHFEILISALNGASIEIFKALFAAGIDINARPIYGPNLLRLIISEKRFHLLDWILGHPKLDPAAKLESFIDVMQRWLVVKGEEALILQETLKCFLIIILKLA